LLLGSDDDGAIVIHDVFVVEPSGLPAGVVALLGVGEIRRLGISLDAVLANPGREWELAVPLSLFGRFRRAVRRVFGGCFHSRTPPLVVSHRQWEEDVSPVGRRRLQAGPPPRTPEADLAGRAMLSATK
jgi:hypothetical protein